MKIPIRNLYLLLCYAWDELDQADAVDVAKEEVPDLHNLLAYVLIDGTKQVLRRGLDRGYIEVREETACLRGRVDWQETTRRLLDLVGRAHVVFEDLSPDTQTNRILKATARALLAVPTLTPENREEIAGIWRAMRGIEDISLSAQDFARVGLHRNNKPYRILIHICELIYESLVPDPNGDGYRFRDFMQDEVRMRRLFQRFITNFYRRRQARYSVMSEHPFRWFGAISEKSGSAELPWMRADIVLCNETRRVIVDTKFTPHAFASYYGSKTLQSDHFNQLFGYVHNLSLSDAENRPTDGMLLYPTVSEDFDQSWVMQGHQFRVASINLTGSWSEIDARLRSLVEA